MKVVFARYNRHRLPSFQIETAIIQSDGGRTVVKRALTPEAGNHIRAIRCGYDLVQRHLQAGSLALPRLTGQNGASISFQYIEGESLDQILFQSFRNKDRESFFQTIDNYCALLKKSFRFLERPVMGGKVGEVFGFTALDQSADGGWLPVAAADAVFENIIICGKSYYLIDSEWVFEGSLPFLFMLFRSLFYFHRVKYFEIGIEKWISFDELLERYQIHPELANRYRAAEEKFQAYVYGPERCYKYKEQYRKREIFVHALEQTIEHQRAVLRKYHKEILSMRRVLAEKDRIIDEIVNSFGWRLWQKIASAVNFLCPAGSRRRRMTDRMMSVLKARKKSS